MIPAPALKKHHCKFCGAKLPETSKTPRKACLVTENLECWRRQKYLRARFNNPHRGIPFTDNFLHMTSAEEKE